MKEDKELDRLIDQGYLEIEISANPKSRWLTRFTPFACMFFSTIGLFTGSVYYFMSLSILMLIGVFSSLSFYDLLYKYIFSGFLKWGQVPKHSKHRKIGCALGSFIFLNAAYQIVQDNLVAAYTPVLLLILLASFAGYYNWCFITEISKQLFNTKQSSCCSSTKTS
ncbi:hypothetical protein E9993_18475 [Labilibacter sediminis]|nr:hypothetical protein E9993_18475 [Labilibacter sediminis]